MNSNEIQAPLHTPFQKSSLKKKSGYLLKKGDGPIDFSWNQRYIILDGKMFMYFKYQDEKTPRAVIRLSEAAVSNVIRHEEREFVFYFELNNPSRRYYFSGDTKQVLSKKFLFL